MSPALLAWLSQLRAEASEPGFICRTLKAKSGAPIAFFNSDIEPRKTDAELWAHIVTRYKDN